MPQPITSPFIEIFRAGTHVDMHGRQQTFTRDDLVSLAAGYDPATSEAPIVVGHPTTNGPAYGWVRGLKVDGDVLSAELGQVDAAFADMVRDGRFKKRSASFFLPDGKDNPTPGQLYLRHVGFLGAAAPAVKGLKEVSFAGDDAGTAEFAMGDRRWGFATAADLFRRVRDYLIDTVGLEKADQVISPWQIDSLKDAAQPDAEASAIGFSAPNPPKEPTVPDPTADFAARDEDLKKREERIAADEKRIAERQAQERRTDAMSFADGLVTARKLFPKDKPAVVELLLALPADAPLAFANGDETVQKPAGDVFRTLLTGMPELLNFAEKSGTEVSGDAGTASFVAPAGTHVNPTALELHRKALAYQDAHPGTAFIAAVKAVGG